MAVPTAVPVGDAEGPERGNSASSSKESLIDGVDTALIQASGRFGITGPVKAAGLVFGDIGTSPIYTLTVILLYLPRADRRLYQGSSRSRSTSSAAKSARRGRP